MFFYDYSTRTAATGKIDASGAFVHLQTFPVNQFGKWPQIASVGCGVLFFYSDEGANVLSASGRVDGAGGYTHLKDYPANQFAKSFQVVPLGGGRVFFYNSTTGAAKVGKFDTSGNYTNLKDSQAGTFGKWTSIVPFETGEVFFYNGDFADETGTQAAIGKFDSFGAFSQTASFPVNQFGKWSSITALAGRWALFQYSDGVSFPQATGQFTAAGAFNHKKNVALGRFWGATPIDEGSQLFLYSSAGSDGGAFVKAASGRMDAAGDIKLRDLGPSFDRWSHIVAA
ncbi:hypothetical protein EAO71_00985 [Streptomyces sp. ms191]|uniref:hypothetical protein n=1 Tax=Streptomyces sp. ms191 TaxID=1827978 RepID=UPI0011CE2197|nr:hypothetical protein [Streptomyces sp. ms191]TXS34525.1 hypothetical protein EAO71_00985 [Streptomyces sp. ms191]